MGRPFPSSWTPPGLPALVAALVLSMAACGPRAVPREQLEPVPAPALDEFDPAVQEQLGTQRAALDALLARPDSTTPDLAEAFGQSGRLYHLYNLEDAAAASYRNARLLAPEDLRWAYLLGVLSDNRGQLDEARECFLRVLELQPGDLPSLLRLGEVELKTDHPEAAQKLFEQVLAIEPDNAAAHGGLGRALLATGQAEEAVKHLETALAAQPEALQLEYPLGQAYRKLGNEEQARIHLERRGPGPARFEDPLFASLVAEAKGASFYLQRGSLALRDGSLDAALRDLRQAVEAAPEQAAPHTVLAAALARSGYPEEAVEHYRKALSLAPDDPVAAHNLGAVFLQMGQPAAAEEPLRHALELAPDLDDARLKLASVLTRLGRGREALELYQQQLAREPGNVAARLGRVQVLLATGHRQEGLGELRTLARNQPRNGEVQLDLGLALAAGGDLAEARSQLQSITASELAATVRAQAEAALGDLQRTRGDAAGAVEHYRRALELDENLGPARFYLAGFLGAQGRFAEAAEHYARVVRLEPLHTAARQGEATALLLAGRYAEARQRLEDGLRRLPKDQDLALLLARVLAAAPDPTVRDGEHAVALAEALFKVHQDLDRGRVLAMAYAAAGRFEDARRWQQGLLQEAAKTGNPALQAQLQTDLERFAAGQPAQSPWGSPGPG